MSQKSLKQIWIEISKQIVNDPNYLQKWQRRDGISCIYTEAQIYYYQQEWEKAKEKLEEVIKQTEEIGWIRLMNYGQNWLADVAIEQRDLEKAEKLLKMGLPVAQRNKDRRRDILTEDVGFRSPQPNLRIGQEKVLKT
jgi:LuxR family glucitol operon transcriptional activator